MVTNHPGLHSSWKVDRQGKWTVDVRVQCCVLTSDNRDDLCRLSGTKGSIWINTDDGIRGKRLHMTGSQIFENPPRKDHRIRQRFESMVNLSSDIPTLEWWEDWRWMSTRHWETQRRFSEWSLLHSFRKGDLLTMSHSNSKCLREQRCWFDQSWALLKAHRSMTRRSNDRITHRKSREEGQRTMDQSCSNCPIRREVKFSRSYIGQLGFFSSVADFSLPFARHLYPNRRIIMCLEKLIYLPVGRRRRRSSKKKRWFYSSFSLAFRSGHLCPSKRLTYKKISVTLHSTLPSMLFVHLTSVLVALFASVAGRSLYEGREDLDAHLSFNDRFF